MEGLAYRCGWRRQSWRVGTLAWLTPAFLALYRYICLVKDLGPYTTASKINLAAHGLDAIHRGLLFKVWPHTLAGELSRIDEEALACLCPFFLVTGSPTARLGMLRPKFIDPLFAAIQQSHIFKNCFWRMYGRVYPLYLVLSLLVQMYQWWFPWLFGVGAPYGGQGGIKQWKKRHEHDYKMTWLQLPQRDVVPDLESTVLLFLLTFALVVSTWKSAYDSSSMGVYRKGGAERSR